MGLYEGNIISSWTEQGTFHEGGRIGPILKKEDKTFQAERMNEEKGKEKNIEWVRE